jgi:hypothetical protein
MANTRSFVGRVSGKPLSAAESGIGRRCRRRSFPSVEAAVAFIDHLKKLVPDEVASGAFYLDAPEQKELR